MVTLKTLVDRYNGLAKGSSTPVALVDFGLSPSETEKVFNGLDEDYQISRHLHFSKVEGKSYTISGQEVTHLAIDPAISNLL
jgi:hypothetical protein